jgi:cysteine desulfurase
LAIKGIALSKEKEGQKGGFVTSEIEHHAVLHSFQWLEERGHRVTYLPVDRNGLVNPDDLREAIREKDTELVSIMYANNEIGTIEPIEELSLICKEEGVLFHTDAVQAYGKYDLPMENIDMLSASGHKIYGPKGVGLLYVRQGVKLDPLLSGGGHEGGLRSGTENTAGIVGLAAATELMENEAQQESTRQREMRDRIIEEALKLPHTRLNGDRERRLFNNVNISFDYIEGESIVMTLDDYGIAASTGSACSSPSLEPSHVLLALGMPPQQAHGSLRITLGRNNDREDVDKLLQALPRVVENLRRVSPLGPDS